MSYKEAYNLLLDIHPDTMQKKEIVVKNKAILPDLIISEKEIKNYYNNNGLYNNILEKISTEELDNSVIEKVPIEDLNNSSIDQYLYIGARVLTKKGKQGIIVELSGIGGWDRIILDGDNTSSAIRRKNIILIKKKLEKNTLNIENKNTLTKRKLSQKRSTSKKTRLQKIQLNDVEPEALAAKKTLSALKNANFKDDKIEINSKLRRRTIRPVPHGVRMGRWIEIYCADLDEWVLGRIEFVDILTGMLKISYTDGSVRVYDGWEKKYFRFVNIANTTPQVGSRITVHRINRPTLESTINTTPQVGSRITVHRFNSPTLEGTVKKIEGTVGIIQFNNGDSCTIEFCH
jgi:hypothetical protein